MATVDGVSGPGVGDKNMPEPQNIMITDPSHDTSSDDSYTDTSGYDADSLCELDDVDKDYFIGEATMVDTNGPEPEEDLLPPALPQKSSLRASRLLEGFKLSPIETSTPPITRHDVYMSSEEDASSSAGDFSDYDWDSSSDSSEDSPVRRKSYEDTARVVSVIYSGKPCIVDLPSPRRSRTPSTIGTASESGSFETFDTAESSPPRRSALEEQHPPRTSSLLSRPSFLGDDPFADDSNYSLDSVRTEMLDGTPRTKGPAVFNRMQRTFSLVRKRSRPLLRIPTGESSGATSSKEDVASITSVTTTPPTLMMAPLVTPSGESIMTDSPVDSTAVFSPRSPVRYSDIMRTARKNSSKTNSVASLPIMSPLVRKSTSSKALSISTLPSIPPASPAPPKRGLLSGLKNRRKSLRG